MTIFNIPSKVIKIKNKSYEQIKSSIFVLYDPSKNNIKPEDIEADIILIHGLKGGGLKTWRQIDISKKKINPRNLKNFIKLNKNEKIDVVDHNGNIIEKSIHNKFAQWPVEMLPIDFPNCRILSVHYDSTTFRKPSSLLKFNNNIRNKSKSTIYNKENSKSIDQIGIEDFANSILNQFSKSDIGSKRPIIFVTHSLGGIIAKYLVLSDKNLSDYTKGIIFFGVPHYGSSLMYPFWLKPLLSRTSLELLSSNKYLHSLQSQFLETAFKKKINCISFVESKCSRFFFNILKLKDMIVPLSCANPMIGDVIQVGNVDHTDICKPLSRIGDIRYEAILKFITSILY